LRISGHVDTDVGRSGSRLVRFNKGDRARRPDGHNISSKLLAGMLKSEEEHLD
jgi:hypothetical protein